ncbi:MAG: PilZ domain-containing protein [Lachnospiraceae bacterium]|nr:PilZ domain-containing protein [Lachnospiraceae bacterium]
MEEKRKDKRLPITMTLEISSLFKQDNILLSNLDAPITVFNVSKGGLGFSSANDLPLGFYFNACLTIGSNDAKLYCVVKIIRKEPGKDGEFTYGCELVGIAPVLAYIFDDYEKTLSD